jgi:hypothetical protein
VEGLEPPRGLQRMRLGIGQLVLNDAVRYALYDITLRKVGVLREGDQRETLYKFDGEEYTTRGGCTNEDSNNSRSN